MNIFWTSVRVVWVAVFIWDLIGNSRASHLGVFVVVPFIAMLWVRSSKSRLSKIGMCMCMAGALSNGAVVMANGGMMPVDRPERVRSVQGDHKHISMQPSNHLRPLADVVYFGGMISSIGDILIGAGLGVALAGFVIRKLREYSEGRSVVMAG